MKSRDAAVGVLVDEDVVEAARQLRLADAGHFAHGGCVGEPGHVEDHRAQVGVGAALPELQRLHDIVAVPQLEVLHVHAAGAHVQVLVLDAPFVEEFGVLGIGDGDDVEALGSDVAVDHPRDVGVGAVHLLFQVEVGYGQARAERDVAEDVDVVAAGLGGGPLGVDGGGRRGEEEGGGEGQGGGGGQGGCPCGPGGHGDSLHGHENSP